MCAFLCLYVWVVHANMGCALMCPIRPVKKVAVYVLSCMFADRGFVPVCTHMHLMSCNAVR